MLINPFFVNPSGMPKVLELLFNAADGGSIVDSTGRHSPSLSASGTRGIVGNRLNVAGGGYIRADGISVSSSDFDISSGADFIVDCRGVSVTDNSAYIWRHTDDDGNLGLTLRFLFNDNRIVLQNDIAVSILDYTAPSSMINTLLDLTLEIISGRTALLINDIEVAFTNSPLTGIGGNGFIIGHLGSSTGTTTIDSFVVKKG